MIKKFIENFEKNKKVLEANFTNKHPESYTDIVTAVIEAVANGDDYDTPDSTRIHLIDDGDYQGTLVYVIAESGYQPNNYWYVKVYYGSCSGCDTLQSIRGYEDDPPTPEQVKDYMGLALNVVQGLKKMGDD